MWRPLIGLALALGVNGCPSSRLRNRRSWSSLSASSAGALMLAGMMCGTACDPIVEPQVVVVLTAGPASTSRATHLRVTVIDAEGAVALGRVLSLGADAELTLPARIPITARDGDASRRFELVAELFDAPSPPPAEGGAPFNLLRVQAGYEPDAVIELPVEIGDACIGHSDCGEGRTCWQGACRGSCFGAVEDGIGVPACTECQRCGASGACSTLAAGSPCGCAGDTCQGDRCEPAKPISLVAGGETHTCALPGTRDLHCWGGNARGQLGIEGSTGETSPRALEMQYRDFDAGGRQEFAHACAIVERTGELHCWGGNEEGQLGLGDTIPREIPTRVGTIEAQRVATGGVHTCAIDRDGAVHCWGRNVYGQVGTGSSAENVLVPTPVTSDLTFTELCAGDSHNCALASDGSVHCWGQNDDGELGLAGDLAPRDVPTRVSSLGGQSWRSVACGAFHSCAISMGGTVYCWGGNEHGNLGRGGGLADDSVAEPIDSALAFAALACSGSHCCATEQGTDRAFCWGGNTDGEVGDGTTFDAVSVPRWVAPGIQFTGFGLGVRHSCAIDDTGSLYCWGYNDQGQLGVGDTAQRLLPSRVCFP